eukprot:gene9423-14605_t
MAEHDAVVEGYGVARNVATREACEELKKYIHVETKRAKDAEDSARFGKVREPENRYDLLLEMEGPVKDVVNSVMASMAVELRSVFQNPGARLIELAAITSYPGAESQPVHADSVHGVLRFLQADASAMLGGMLGASGGLWEDEEQEACDAVLQASATDTAPMWTMLVALQDIDESMGPTHVWPGTANVDHHSRCYSHYVSPMGLVPHDQREKLSVELADEMFEIQHKKMTLSAGDLVYYDSRTMHCGGANKSDKSRSVLVLTFVGAGMMPEGSTYDLLPHLINKYRLSSFPLLEDGSSRPKLDVDVAQEEAADKQRRQEDEEKRRAKPIPPLNEWMACVQCT